MKTKPLKNQNIVQIKLFKLNTTTMEKNLVKFYADTPRGEKNKLFTFKVQNYEHATDLAAKFVQEKGFIIRAAWYVNPKGLSMRIDLFSDLKTHKNSIIEKQDKVEREKKQRVKRLKILNSHYIK